MKLYWSLWCFPLKIFDGFQEMEELAFFRSDLNCLVVLLATKGELFNNKTFWFSFNVFE